MKIALINENSQAAKNGIIEAALKKVVEPMGHEVVNYGMYAADDKAQLTYVQCGILAAILLNSGAADYVITGCGTGEGAMLALNSFPGVICGHVEDPVDAYTFAHVNDGNAVAMPFAKGFGWGGELNLEYCFEKLFGFGHGQGYPKERVEPEQRNKKILDGVRAATFQAPHRLPEEHRSGPAQGRCGRREVQRAVLCLLQGRGAGCIRQDPAVISKTTVPNFFILSFGCVVKNDKIKLWVLTV